ncbi:MAG: peptide chain release factor N(5)-glutamine methyltransferase [Oscillospiraceae bacterium]
MVSFRKLFVRANHALESAGLLNANELSVIFELATGARFLELTRPDDAAPEGASERLEVLLDRRIGGEPLQYIAGTWPFLDFELKIGEGVLIPRPETELLAEKAIDFLQSRPRSDSLAALDLCSGSGCIAIAIARAVPSCTVAAAELSCDAMTFLKHNVSELASGIDVIEADVFELDQRLADSSLDCITCNPPYLLACEYDDNPELEREPREAFVGGADGLEFFRHIVLYYKRTLKSEGALFFETGATQTEAVAELLRAGGYRDIEILRDVFGLLRVVKALA